MILAVDIGNTNIVVGCCDKNKILFVDRLSTKLVDTELEYAVSFKNVFELHNIDTKKIDGGIISSVVPSITNVIKRAVKKTAGIDVMVVGSGIKTGLNILTDNPAQLGSDLVADAVGGINEYKLPLVIIDMGTATTISIINEKGVYTGTVIMPGMGVSLDSLVGRTSQLPKISLDPPKKVVGTNTIDAMKSGILYATAASLDGMIERIEEEIQKKATVVATGGLAGAVIPLCKREIILDDELLLKGLMIMYNKNIS